jgi:Carboxypeptidase regulatory-like domain
MRHIVSCLAVIFLLDSVAFATIFGSVRGIVHDPQHRPIQGARVTLKAQGSDWTQSQDSNDNGEFVFTSVP